MEPVWFPDNENIRQSVRELHQSEIRASIICTGAGFGLGQILWHEPGMENDIFELLYPVEKRAVTLLAGAVPDESCSVKKATCLARTAWSRMHSFAAYFKPQWEIDDIRYGYILAGIGLCASPANGLPRFSQDRICAVLRHDEGTFSVDLVFHKNRTTRWEQGRVADLVALNLLLAAAKLPMLEFDADIFLSGDTFPKPDDPKRCILCPRII